MKIQSSKLNIYIYIYIYIYNVSRTHTQVIAVLHHMAQVVIADKATAKTVALMKGKAVFSHPPRRWQQYLHHNQLHFDTRRRFECRLRLLPQLLPVKTIQSRLL